MTLAGMREDVASARRATMFLVVLLVGSMLVNLDAWVRGGVVPPPSRYPKIADGTLVTLPLWKFPAMPGVTPPRDVHRAVLDRRPDDRSVGVA